MASNKQGKMQNLVGGFFMLVIKANMLVDQLSHESYPKRWSADDRSDAGI